MFQGIHADAKTQWINHLDAVQQNLIDCESPTEILLRLGNAANSISGIGDKTIDETWLYIMEEQGKQKRGF